VYLQNELGRVESGKTGELGRGHDKGQGPAEARKIAVDRGSGWATGLWTPPRGVREREEKKKYFYMFLRGHRRLRGKGESRTIGPEIGHEFLSQ